MPIGEVIGEIILRPIFELVFYGLSYGTGYLFLKGLSLGSIRLAPLATIQEKNRSKRKWYQIDWSPWLYRPMQGRLLKADCTCLVGMLIWAAVGFGIYYGTRGNESEENKSSLLTPAAYPVCSIMSVKKPSMTLTSMNARETTGGVIAAS